MSSFLNLCFRCGLAEPSLLAVMKSEFCKGWVLDRINERLDIDSDEDFDNRNHKILISRSFNYGTDESDVGT